MKIQLAFLISFIFLVLAGCGTEPTPSGQTGSISFSIEVQQPQSAGLHAFAVDCSASGIETISVRVLNSNDTEVASADFPCTAHSGVVNNVPAGTFQVVIEGLDTGGAVQYQAIENNVVVQAGATADLVVTLAPVVLPPAAPTGLIAMAGNGQVTLNWTAVTGADSYNVYRGTLSGSLLTKAQIATGITTTSHTDTGRTNGTTYYYQVTAVNIAGESAGSNEDSATPTATPPPVAITAAATSMTDTAATLNGTVNPNGFDTTAYFEWGATTNYGNPPTANQSLGSGTSNVAVTASLTGLTANTTYHFRMVAENANGTSTGADQVFTTPDITAPDNTSNNFISGGNATTASTAVTLSLSATDDVGVTGYYASESPTTPLLAAVGWATVASTTSYSADVPFTLSSGDGTKTVYVWFKDVAGNVSASATDSITLDSTPGGNSGSLDTTFGGGDGIVTTIVGGSTSEAHAMAIQSDGKIVLAGYSDNGSNYDFAVVRYTTAGVPDITFDGDGVVTTAVGAGHDYAHAVAIDSNGNIVVAGRIQNGTDYDIAVVRYSGTDGSLDTSFDGDGKVITVLSAGWDFAYAVAIQSDGKIVVAGSLEFSGSDDFAVVRYNTNGSLDTSFDGDGIARTAVGVSYDYALAVAIQPDGKIVAAGDSYHPINMNYDFAVVRYSGTDGSPDPTFDTDGIVKTDLGGENYGFAVAVQSDNKIVVAGYSGGDFIVVRYNTDGSLDATFDGDGKVTTSIGAGDDWAYAVAIQSDGKIVVAGYMWNGANNDFAVARYNTNGSLDATFDIDGIVITNTGSEDYGYAMAIQSDDKIVVAGYSALSFAVVRYWP